MVYAHHVPERLDVKHPAAREIEKLCLEVSSSVQLSLFLLDLIEKPLSLHLRKTSPHPTLR